MYYQHYAHTSNPQTTGFLHIWTHFRRFMVKNKEMYHCIYIYQSPEQEDFN